MIEACEQEIHELHEFFQEWFAGRLPANDEAFARFAQAMGPDFQMITPGGERVARGALLDGLRGAHGSQPDCRIWIENLSSRELTKDVCLVTYEEWQGSGDDARGRLSSALLRRAAGAPRAVEWLHLHEVWLPAQTSPQAEAR